MWNRAALAGYAAKNIISAEQLKVSCWQAVSGEKMHSCSAIRSWQPAARRCGGDGKIRIAGSDAFDPLTACQQLTLSCSASDNVFCGISSRAAPVHISRASTVVSFRISMSSRLETSRKTY